MDQASTHGMTAYRYGCRCDACRAVNRDKMRKIRGGLRERLAAEFDRLPHDRGTYSNWGCRCDACKADHLLKMKDERQRRVDRLAADPTLVPHGRMTTYDSWGCRCRPCTDAAAAKARRIYAQRKSR